MGSMGREIFFGLLGLGCRVRVIARDGIGTLLVIVKRGYKLTLS